MLSAGRSKESLAGYLELHIEQGKRLERAGIHIGIVSAIVGIWSYPISFIGRADHAGSTTMDDRLDASLGASAFTLTARELVMKEFPNCVVNVGKMEFCAGRVQHRPGTRGPGAGVSFTGGRGIQAARQRTADALAGHDAR